MGIISGLGSFWGRFGDHFRVGDHFGVGIISGAVQDSRFPRMCPAKNGRLIPTAKRGKEIKQSEINIYCTCFNFTAVLFLFPSLP